MNSIVPKQINDESGIEIASHVDTNPADVYLASLGSHQSSLSMRKALKRVLNVLDIQTDVSLFNWHLLRYEHLQLIRNRITESFSPATGNQAIAAIKGVLKSAWRMRLIDSDQYHRTIDIERVRGTRELAGRHISQGEFVALLEACRGRKNRWLGIRDTVLIAFLFGTGMRRSEVISLKISDIDLEDGRLLVRGKGNKERTTYVPYSVIPLINKWLSFRDSDSEYILLTAKRGCLHQPMTAGGVFYAVNKIASIGNVKKFTPHDFRRTFIGNLLDAGADVISIQKMVGHSDPKTTSRYDMRGNRVNQKNATLIHIPFTDEDYSNEK